ncbi:MAG: hypothetical protein JXB48_07160 [Candidatus Latescibacteria bacterium]|nr:hypothetical protein [Candidatus Latescibacterota bacterium]
MYLELKEIETILSGRKLQQFAGNEPYENISISPDTKKEGFRTVGTMKIIKSGNKKEFVSKTGYFLENNNSKE